MINNNNFKVCLNIELLKIMLNNKEINVNILPIILYYNINKMNIYYRSESGGFITDKLRRYECYK